MFWVSTVREKATKLKRDYVYSPKVRNNSENSSKMNENCEHVTEKLRAKRA